ncbi:MAG: hypothetical protein HEQ35_05315 [Gloeotrichia echinulata IR180]
MTQPNFQKVTQQKLQNSWPLWFPYPSAWLKALILQLFLSLIIFSLKNYVNIGYRIAYFAQSPELLVIVTIMLFLSPIPIISFTHHFLHLLISRFISEIQAPEIGKIQGLLPGLMSWWEGLYAWLVIAISTLVATFFSTILLPFFNLSYLKKVEYYTDFEKTIIVIFGVLYIFTAALIYQIEYLVKRRLISAYSGNKESDKNKLNTDSNINQDLNRLRAEMGLHKMGSKILSKNYQNPLIKNRGHATNIDRNILIISMIFLISVFTYVSLNFREILPIESKKSTQIPSNSVLVTPSPVTSESPTVLLQADTFREGVNKAINAANLTQSAKSPDEWKIVVSQWEAAIALMKNVPSSSQNYAVAQQKIREYQRNLNYAEKNSATFFLDKT